MFSAVNTKLLVVIVALLATIVAYLGYERHKEQIAERQRQEFLRKRTPQEKKYVDGALTDWGRSAATQNKK